MLFWEFGLPVNMETQVNMAQLLPQPQQKLQLDYKTNITQNHQKIDLCGSLTTKKLKKPPSSRCLGGVEMWRFTDRQDNVKTQNR